MEYNFIHSKWRIQGGGWFQFFFNNKWLHPDTTAIVKDSWFINYSTTVGYNHLISNKRE